MFFKHAYLFTSLRREHGVCACACRVKRKTFFFRRDRRKKLETNRARGRREFDERRVIACNFVKALFNVVVCPRRVRFGGRRARWVGGKTTRARVVFGGGEKAFRESVGSERMFQGRRRRRCAREERKRAAAVVYTVCHTVIRRGGKKRARVRKTFRFLPAATRTRDGRDRAAIDMFYILTCVSDEFARGFFSFGKLSKNPTFARRRAVVRFRRIRIPPAPEDPESKNLAGVADRKKFTKTIEYRRLACHSRGHHIWLGSRRDGWQP